MFPLSVTKSYSGKTKSVLDPKPKDARPVPIVSVDSAEAKAPIAEIIRRNPKNAKNFNPDFLVWVGQRVIAIDTKGDHLIVEDAGRKLFHIESLGRGPNKPRMASNRATPRSSRERSSSLRAKRRHRADLSPGADAIATAEQKVADLRAQIDANRDLSTSLAFDRAPAA
jgi:hypothetical protein